MSENGGMVGRIISASLDGTLPVIVLLIAFGVGSFALLQTPREEEPQIVVPMSDVIIAAPSLSAPQVERLVTTPLEKILTQIDGVEHVYSVSRDGAAVVTVRFFVGEDREDSLVKLYNKIFSNQDLIPAPVTQWVVKPVEIDDVPIVIATLWSDSPQVADYELRRLADELAISLQAVHDTNRIEVIGGAQRQFRIDLDPAAMVARRTDIADVLQALQMSNLRVPAGNLQLANNEVRVETDARVRSIEDLAALTIKVINGVAVRLADIAAVADGPPALSAYHWIGFGPAHPRYGAEHYPAVHIAVAKKKGTNAVRVSHDLAAELQRAAGELFPAGVHLEITRDYGATADAKISDLISSLGIAVATVVVLIGLTLGWRAALVVALTVPVCYGLTLTLDYAAGYTINRVTLFALILALGLLVDDPITGVDNIERHLGRGASRREEIINAMVEIRMPLLMSTVAIVVAFAPMSFITGMMGPYMSPMAFNVPVAVVLSTAVALCVTPWLGRLALRPRPSEVQTTGAAQQWYAARLRTLLTSRSKSWWFLGATAVLFLAVLTLPMLRLVPLKLLPYDNKNEFQVIIDAPEHMPVESTAAIAQRVTEYLQGVPEVRSVSAFVGSHSPMDFNGLVRHYYLRGQPHEADLRVTLAERLSRPEPSHTLILRIRPDIEQIAAAHGVSIKLVEVPPGPPVVATLVGEHYGSATTSYERLLAAAASTAARLAREPGVVDVDVSAESPSQRMVFLPDQRKAALSGVSNAVIADTLRAAVDGVTVSYAAVEDEVNPLPIVVRLPYDRRDELTGLHVEGMPGIAKVRARGRVADAPTSTIALGELGTFVPQNSQQPIHHKDLRRVTYAFAEVAGRVPAAVIYDLDADRAADAGHDSDGGRPLSRRTYFTPGGGDAWSLPDDVTLTWAGEGEWNITLRVFRDLGIAFGVALVGIFAVIRLQTGLSALTGIIMLSIPLTAIGIMPGFWLLNLVAAGQVGSYADPILFTATAMIGMIALAGIVVRNSLMLVEFIQHALERGVALRDALIEAGQARARPVLLTAGTTLLGNLVITLDPIFSGLAWAVIFGVVASTAFTLFVVPVVYHLVYGDSL